MSDSATNSGLRDNHSRGTVAQFLTETIQDGSRLSVVSAYFTVYAYAALRGVLDRIGHLNFLFGEPSFINRLDPDRTEKKAFLIDVARSVTIAGFPSLSKRVLFSLLAERTSGCSCLHL